MESVRNLDYIEIFNENITPYTQVDFQKIKPNTTIKNIRDLEKEGKAISEILKDAKSKLLQVLRFYYCQKPIGARD